MMKGWKTWLAAIAMVLWGCAGFLADMHNADVALGFITGGIGLIGLGHKIERGSDKVVAAVAGEPVMIAKDTVATATEIKSPTNTVVQK